MLAKSLDPAALKSIGGESNFPKTLRYIPLQYFGLDIPYPYIEQGVEHLHFWIEHADAKTLSVHFLHSHIYKLQLKLGLNTLVLIIPFGTSEILVTDGCIKHFWYYLYANHVTLKIPESKKFPILRNNDKILLNYFIALGFKGTKLLQINKCRLAQIEITRSDVLSVNVYKVIPEALIFQNQPTPN